MAAFVKKWFFCQNCNLQAIVCKYKKVTGSFKELFLMKTTCLCFQFLLFEVTSHDSYYTDTFFYSKPLSLLCEQSIPI